MIIDYNETPGDPDDDVFVSPSRARSRIVGHLETEDRDFCEDFIEFTS